MEDLQLLISEPRDRVLEMRLAGEIDMASAPPFREAARLAVASGDYDCLVIDLAGVEFMDSNALHVLAEANRVMTAAGGTITVVCPDPKLRTLLELTGLDRALTIVPVPSAVDAVTA